MTGDGGIDSLVLGCGLGHASRRGYTSDSSHFHNVDVAAATEEPSVPLEGQGCENEGHE